MAGIFKIKNLSPIGFKIENYPVKYCSICRGYLTNVCSACDEIGCEICTVVNMNNIYYHNHCYSLMNDKSKPSSNTVNQVPMLGVPVPMPVGPVPMQGGPVPMQGGPVILVPMPGGPVVAPVVAPGGFDTDVGTETDTDDEL